MKDQRPNEFDEFKKMQDTFSPLCIRGKLRSFMNKSVERAASVIKNPEHKKIMLNFRNTFADTIDDFLLGPSSKEFGIIGHGDCWNNNFLFQYRDNDVCIHG